MTAAEFIEFLGAVEALKSVPRHCVLRSGRVESVADHSWRLGVMAMLCGGEVEGIDREKLIKMALIHDFGEAVTGDIPTFNKNDGHRAVEREAVRGLISALPEPQRGELTALFAELDEQKTPEARLLKALDKCEALLSHNESDISTWLPLEYDLQLTYAQRECAEFPFTAELRRELEASSRRKIEGAENDRA